MIVSMTIVSIRNGYVRLYTPIICSAGGRQEAQAIYRYGSAVSSSLLAATSVLWAIQVATRESKVDPSYQAGAEYVGAACGCLCALFLFLTAHYGIFEYPTLHNVLFGVAVSFGMVWGGFMIATAAYGASHGTVPSSLFTIRIILLCICGFAVNVTFGLMQHGISVKKKSSHDNEQEADPEAATGQIENASRSDGSGEKKTDDEQIGESDTDKDEKHWLDDSKEESNGPRPWDKWIRAAAQMQYFALMTFCAMILTTIGDFLH